MTDIEKLKAALIAARPYVAKAADSFGSDWEAMKVLKQIDDALTREQ